MIKALLAIIELTILLGIISIFIIGIIIAPIFYLAHRKVQKEKEISKQPRQRLDVIDNSKIDSIRMQATLAQEKNSEKIKFIREMDVRQFQGRNDVTIDEVVTYMIEHSQFIGIEKRLYQMERITQVCNLTKEDMDEVFHRTWGKCKIMEDKEGQRQRDWEISKNQESIRKQVSFWREFKEENKKYLKTKEELDKWEKRFPERKVQELEEKDYWNHEQHYRFNDYENWLKKKGYVK